MPQAEPTLFRYTVKRNGFTDITIDCHHLNIDVTGTAYLFQMFDAGVINGAVTVAVIPCACVQSITSEQANP